MARLGNRGQLSHLKQRELEEYAIALGMKEPTCTARQELKLDLVRKIQAYLRAEGLLVGPKLLQHLDRDRVLERAKGKWRVRRILRDCVEFQSMVRDGWVDRNWRDF